MSCCWMIGIVKMINNGMELEESTNIEIYRLTFIS